MSKVTNETMGAESLTNSTEQDEADDADRQASQPASPLHLLWDAPRAAWRWLLRHEAEPAPFDAGLAGRIALAVVACVVLIYAIILTGYVFGVQDNFRTSAEDLGIMDQVLWNTSHGHFMLQSICNNVTDTNCLGDVSRFAIHFEPILILLSLLYVIIPNVKVILFLQVAVVASGAFPAYLLATRRLRNVVWGVLFAVLFLIYPSLQAAVIDDFHPETLAATTIMWAMYFLATRRYRGLIIFCVITLLCKETLALDVMMIGAFVLLIHRRARVGIGLILSGVAMLGLALLLMHLASPLGQSPVAGRLDYFKQHPLAAILQIATDPARRSYLFKLLAPVGFLAVLSPWMLALAVPAMFLNLASSYPLMYSGIYQYNTDIVPILVAAAIDALVWLAPLLERAAAWVRAFLRQRWHAPTKATWLLRPQLLALMVLLIVGFAGRSSLELAFHVDAVIVRSAFPSINQHDQTGERIAAMIPAGASVSAQGTLAPHVSERFHIYQFPFDDTTADYVFVDVTTGDFYPYVNSNEYVNQVMGLLNSCKFELTAAQDGYILLHRLAGEPQPGQACPIALPQAFYTFAYANPPAGASPAAVSYANALELVGYTISPSKVNLAEPETTVATYWKVLAPIPVSQPLTVVTTFTRPDGYRIEMTDAFTQTWLPPDQWQVGSIVKVVSWPLYLNPHDKGNLLFGVEVRAGAPFNHPTAEDAVPAMLLSGTATSPTGFPRLVNNGTSALLTTMLVY